MNIKYLNSITIEQMIGNKYNPVVNQFIIKVNGGIIFQSYNSTIAVVNYDTRVITIYPDWDGSKTTGKYRNIFFRDYVHIRSLSTKRGFKKALKDGKINDWKIIRK